MILWKQADLKESSDYVLEHKKITQKKHEILFLIDLLPSIIKI